jgi:hypothetical protein
MPVHGQSQDQTDPPWGTSPPSVKHNKQGDLGGEEGTGKGDQTHRDNEESGGGSGGSNPPPPVQPLEMTKLGATGFTAYLLM